MKVEKSGDFLIVTREDGVERRGPLSSAYFNILSNGRISIVLGEGIFQEKISANESDLVDYNDNQLTIEELSDMIENRYYFGDPTITAVGGVISNCSFTPLFDYLSSGYYYNFPIVDLTYPGNTGGLNVFSGYSFGSFGELTELEFNGVDALVNLTSSSAIPSQLNAVTLKFNDLKYIYGLTGSSTNGLIFSGSSTTSVLMPELEFVAQTFSFATASPITSFSFPKLKVVSGSLTNRNAALTTLSLPELLQGGFFDSTNSGIQSINLPKLKVLSGLGIIGTKSSLTSIQLPVIEYCSQISFPTTSTSLSTFTFGDSLKFYGITNTTGNFVTTSNSLDESSVDNILISLAALDGTNGTTEFSNRTVTITGSSATPSSSGLTAKATLVSRGCTVTTN